MFSVFVVEDSSLLRKEIVMTTPWHSLDCQVVGEAENGEDGYKGIQSLRPDIVITDICMPVVDGLEMIESLVDVPDIKYIIISAHNELEHAMKAIKLQVKDYILKPICDQELYSTIHRVTEEIRQAQEYRSMKQDFRQISDNNPLFLRNVDLAATQDNSRYAAAIMQYIQQNYQQDITVRDVAKALLISESYLSKLMRRELGNTFVDYLNYYRIKMAMQLLCATNSKVYQVAEEVGFKDYRYFCTAFKKHVGISPKRYQKGSVTEKE